MAGKAFKRAALALLLGASSPVLAQDDGAAQPAQSEAPPVTHFSMVGFPINLGDEAKFNATIDRLTGECELFELDEDDRLCLTQNEQGGQFWIGLRESKEGWELRTANPAFVGESRFPVIATGTQSEPSWEPFEYRLSATFGEYQIPLLVELADPREAARFAPGSPQQAVTLDLTAFTFRPKIFKSAAEFKKDQLERGAQTVYASNFFIPSGLFGDTPRARASFAGKVLKARNWEGPDGREFWIVLAEVMDGASVNIVFAGDAAQREPKRGNLIIGEFWLSAQIAPDAAR